MKKHNYRLGSITFTKEGFNKLCKKVATDKGMYLEINMKDIFDKLEEDTDYSTKIKNDGLPF